MAPPSDIDVLRKENEGQQRQIDESKSEIRRNKDESNHDRREMRQSILDLGRKMEESDTILHKRIGDESRDRREQQEKMEANLGGKLDKMSETIIPWVNKQAESEGSKKTFVKMATIIVSVGVAFVGLAAAVIKFLS